MRVLRSGKKCSRRSSSPSVASKTPAVCQTQAHMRDQRRSVVYIQEDFKLAPTRRKRTSQNNRKLNQRLAVLEGNQNAYILDSALMLCLACSIHRPLVTIKLDTRPRRDGEPARYYPNLWDKHEKTAQHCRAVLDFRKFSKIRLRTEILACLVRVSDETELIDLQAGEKTPPMTRINPIEQNVKFTQELSGTEHALHLMEQRLKLIQVHAHVNSRNKPLERKSLQDALRDAEQRTQALKEVKERADSEGALLLHLAGAQIP